LKKVKANEAQYLFLCSEYQINTFDITDITITDKISSLYEVQISLVSTTDMVLTENCITKKATIFLNRNGECYSYSGIITSFNFVESNVDCSVYKIILRPQLWKLTLSVQTRIFQKKSIPDIIKEVLDQSGLETYYDMSKLNLSAYQPCEYIVQYDETDYNFIMRLMEENGICFLFKEFPLLREEIGSTCSQEVLVISDSSNAFIDLSGESSIKYQSRSDLVKSTDKTDMETVFEMELCRKFIPESVIVKSYNYRTPTVDLSAKSKIDGGNRGVIYEFGGNYKNIDEAQQRSDVIARRIAMTHTIIEGKSDCKGFRVGNKVKVTEHSRDELNGQFVITEVYHCAKNLNHESTLHGSSYENTFVFLPLNRAVNFVPESRAERKQIPGVINATIEGMGSEYASIDDHGRYKVRMAFDISKSDACMATKPIRQAQAYSGSNYGMHFPSHGNAEMIIAHVNGDPSKPIGLGTVPNANTMTPVKGDNKQQSAIVTAGGNKIILDDTNNSQKFNLITPYNQSFSAGNNENVSVAVDRLIKVSENESKGVTENQELSVGGDQLISVDGKKDEMIEGSLTQSVTGNKKETVASNKRISVTNASCEKVTANRSINVTGEDGLSVNAAHKVIVGGDATQNVGNSASIESKAMITIKGSGAVSLEGSEIFLNGKAVITLVSGGSSVVISAGAIMITAPTVSISGTEVTIAAGAVNNMLAGLIKIN
jgi:type VI secretion system secreted protein VgrG